jgi:hypothetical protein
VGIYSIDTYSTESKANIFIRGNLLPAISGAADNDGLGYSLGFDSSWKWAAIWAVKGRFNSIYTGTNMD